MTLMSRKVDYALLILFHLAHRPEGASAREITNRFGLSKGFVANILKLLCHKGFVASHRGVKGGYVLRRATEDVNLAELMEALEEGFHLAECNKASDTAFTHEPLCPLKGAISELHHRIRDVLREATLAELFRPSAEGPRNGLPLGLLPLETQLVAH